MNQFIFFCKNGNYTSFTNAYLDRNPGSPVLLKDYVEIFNKYVNQDLLESYSNLKIENELLKQQVEELKKYEEYSNKFLSLEPKKKLKLNLSEIEQIKISRQNGMTIKELAKTYGVSYKTIYNYLKK